MALKNGKIFFNSLDKNPVDLELTQNDAWIKKMLERAAPLPELCGKSAEEWAGDVNYQTHVMVNQLAGSQEEFSVSGNFAAVVPTLCAHCGEEFKADRKGDFQIFLEQVDKKKENPEDSGDPDLIYVSGPEFDLADILAEQMIVNEPIAEHCAACALIIAEDEANEVNKALAEPVAAFSKLAEWKKN